MESGEREIDRVNICGPDEVIKTIEINPVYTQIIIVHVHVQ